MQTFNSWRSSPPGTERNSTAHHLKLQRLLFCATFRETEKKSNFIVMAVPLRPYKALELNGTSPSIFFYKKVIFMLIARPFTPPRPLKHFFSGFPNQFIINNKNLKNKKFIICETKSDQNIRSYFKKWNRKKNVWGQFRIANLTHFIPVPCTKIYP